MTDFTAVPIPEDAETAQDAAPGDDVPHCIVCGKELEYSGRGRKPKYCAEHKKGGQRTGVKASTPRNEKLAAQATDALMQINGIVGLICMVGALPYTAEAIKNAEPELREQVHAALVTDPDLCAQILRGGTKSSKVSLIIAYGMFAATVVPVATVEIKARKALKESEIIEDAVNE